MKHGVQSFVLRPLLFLLRVFMNDLLRVIQNAEVILLAADTNILITSKNILSLNEKIKIYRKIRNLVS
jgi:hypothetical protein